MGEAERIMQLFERLPEAARGELIDFAEFLARKADPVAWALDNAPLDDEPLTAEEIAEIEAAKAEYAEKGGIPLEQIEAELGL
jgi:hypothetical protein